MDAEVTPLRNRGAASPPASAAPAAPAASGGTRPSAEEIGAIAAALGQVDAAHRRLRTRLAHRLGLTVTDLVALIVVSEDRECTPKALANELGVTSGSATAIIDRLVQSDQIRRVPKVGDRRSLLLELTEQGSRTVETVSGLYVGAIAIALEASPHVFNRQILDSLRSTADALDNTADDHAAETEARGTAVSA